MFTFVSKTQTKIYLKLLKTMQPTKHLSRAVVAPRVHFSVFSQCQRVVAPASHPGHPRVDELGHQEGGIPHSGNSAADLRVHVVTPAVHFSFYDVLGLKKFLFISVV